MSWLSLFWYELRAILTNPAVMLTVFVGVVFYSFLYPQPYATQVPRELSLVVANLDNSQMSRTLERMVDATPQIRIVRHASSLEEAQAAFVNDRLAGLLIIPENFYRDILLGRRPTLSYGGDASYFLVYGAVLEGLSMAGGTLDAGVKINRMVITGKTPEQALQNVTPVGLNVRSVFNSTGAYLNYVLPAVFVLILHHTLVIGTGLLSGGQKEDSSPENYWQQVSSARLLITRTFVFGTIYLLFCGYYFGFCFSLYEVPRLAAISDLWMIAIPFLLSATFLGVFLGYSLPRKELVTLVAVLSSLPIIFTSGFIWPIEAIPVWLVSIVQWIPVIPAISAFIKLNQMGADLSDVLPLLLQQWLLVMFYGALSWFLLQRRR